MIYQDTKRFLKRHIITPSSSRTWEGHNNFLYLDFIQGRYSDDEIDANGAEIRQAFRDFFEPVGYANVEFDRTSGIRCSIESYQTEPQNSRHLSSLIDIIRSNRRTIEYPYNNREDQIALSGKIRRAINSEISDSNEPVNKKELIRFAIKKALDLSSRDVVIHLKRKYIVKLFQKNLYLSREVKEPEGINVSERRFRGYNEIDLDNHYQELFNDVSIDDFLDSVMAELFARELNFDEITNTYYENNVLRLIRDAISNELHQYVSHNDDYLIGFAGYIFRKHFESIHQRMAVEIFEQITNKSKNAEKFLDYYSGKIFIENGKRYVIPEITTPDGKRWNVTSLSAIASMWLHTRSKLDRMIAEHKNVVGIYGEISTIYETASLKLTQCNSDLKGLKKQLDEEETIVGDKFKSFKIEKKSEMNVKKETSIENEYRQHIQKISTIKQKIEKLKPEAEQLYVEVNGYKASYLDLKNKVRLLEIEVRELKQNLNLNSDAFHSILASLVKALMQRKRLFEE